VSTGPGVRQALARSRLPAPVSREKLLRWLLEPEQPAVRYLALRQLEGRRENDAEVREARRQIPTDPWVVELLRDRQPEGWWIRERGWLEPRFQGTNWRMLALSDLGVTRTLPEIEVSCEHWMSRSPLQGGGVGGFGKGKGHHCYTGNMARALIRFGYEDDPRVRKSLEWIVRTAHPQGGWACRFSTGGPATSRTLDAWEGLSALAALPRTKRSATVQSCIERGAEYFLERELHLQGERYEPWYRFHWPVHYYYDLLVGLDLLTSLGYADDARLRYALDLLREKRRPDGRWNLEAVQPDPDPESARWFARHPKQRPTPLSFEPPGRPSKMITLRALTVLARVGE
jgi:hypothetical protein